MSEAPDEQSPQAALAVSPPPVAPLVAATTYARKGWSVLPVPHRGKNPGYKNWQLTRLKEQDLPDYFNGRPQKIGVLTGAPSGWLIDVDLDHMRCVELADQYLPRHTRSSAAQASPGRTASTGSRERSPPASSGASRRGCC